MKASEVFSTTKELLGQNKIAHLPNIDVETRSSSTFSMVSSPFELFYLFDERLNGLDVGNNFIGINLDQENWNQLNSIAMLLGPATDVVELSSSFTQVAASIQIRFYRRLVKHFDEPIEEYKRSNSSERSSSINQAKFVEIRTSFHELVPSIVLCA